MRVPTVTGRGTIVYLTLDLLSDAVLAFSAVDTAVVGHRSGAALRRAKVMRDTDVHVVTRWTDPSMRAHTRTVVCTRPAIHTRVYEATRLASDWCDCHR